MSGRICIGMAAAFACSASGIAHADALQDQVVAAARATAVDAHAFRRTITIEQTGSARKVIVEQFDPRRAPPD